jgi:hypothetical protein
MRMNMFFRWQAWAALGLVWFLQGLAHADVTCSTCTVIPAFRRILILETNLSADAVGTNSTVIPGYRTFGSQSNTVPAQATGYYMSIMAPSGLNTYQLDGSVYSLPSDKERKSSSLTMTTCTTTLIPTDISGTINVTMSIFKSGKYVHCALTQK